MSDKRQCGVLLPVSSLPSKYGIGCFSKSAYDFVDALKVAGQSCWQILPLGPTSYGDSPISHFPPLQAILILSVWKTDRRGSSHAKECDAVDFGSDPAVWIMRSCIRAGLFFFERLMSAVMWGKTRNSDAFRKKKTGG